MKLRDFIYDEELKKANLFLEEVEPIQLENLLMILRGDEEEQEDEGENWEEIIFGENN